MILAHGPTIFGDRVLAGVSSVGDGTMKLGPAATSNNDSIYGNMTKFVQGVGIGSKDVTYMAVNYDTDDFRRYARVGKPAKAYGQVTADGLVTDTPGAALFLPLADCTGVIAYDPEHNALALAHLGRHSTEQHGGRDITEFMASEFGTDPARLLVWLGPSPNGGIYPLWKRENMSLHEANRADFRTAGVHESHIEVSPVDTATDQDYFSHSEFLKGRRSVDGRYAIVAALAPHGQSINS